MYCLVVLLCVFRPQGLVAILLDSVDGPPSSDLLPALANPPLKIASFNIQVFGHTKFEHKDVLDVLVKILTRYDIVQVLEIRDSSQTVFPSLKDFVNTYAKSNIGPEAVYEIVASDRLGRSTSKEQYGFLYRPSLVNITDTFQYPDDEDVFEREPFAARLFSPSTVVTDFALVASHIKPADAAQEMDNLTVVYETVQKHWALDDIMISGDFNADCSYLKLGAWNNISLRTDPTYTWLIPDGIDTTVNDRFCCYDRFVVAGDVLKSAVVPGSSQAYRFDEEMALDKEMGLRVSDHYPIELELKGKPHIPAQQSIETSISFTVRDVRPITSINNIRAIYRNPSCAGANYDIKVSMDQSRMDYVTARTMVQSSDYVVDELKQFRTNCPDTLSAELLSVVSGYIESMFLTKTLPNVYGLVYSQTQNVFETIVKCHLQSPYICEISVSKQISGML